MPSDAEPGKATTEQQENPTWNWKALAAGIGGPLLLGVLAVIGARTYFGATGIQAVYVGLAIVVVVVLYLWGLGPPARYATRGEMPPTYIAPQASKPDGEAASGRS